LTGSLSSWDLCLEEDSDHLALSLSAVRTGMDDANYLKTVDKVTVNICRLENSNNSEAAVSSLLFRPSLDNVKPLV
jgi:hypothetical protein